MTKPPHVNGLILCEKVRIETAPASFCLDGVFVVREFDMFPTPRLPLDVYASLFDGRGEGVMKLNCMRLVGEKNIYYHEKWFAFPRQLQTIHYIVPVRKLIFPAPGRYAFTLTFDDRPLTTRYLDAREVRQ